MPLARRPLSFATLADAVTDAEQLLAGGYERGGNWSLGQVGFHLAQWLKYPLDGFPSKSLPWLLRETVGKWYLRRVLRSGSMGERMRTLAPSVGPADLPDAEGVDLFRRAVARWEADPRKRKSSPLFGSMDLVTATHLQRVHAAHHLSFLVPKSL